MPLPAKDPRPPMAIAMEWVSRVLTVVIEMVLPGLAGQWLDHRWGTGYWTLVGFGFGLVLGISHLLAMVQPPKMRNSAVTNPQTPGSGRTPIRDERGSSSSESGGEQR